MKTTQIEQVLIPVIRYRDSQGNPTCAKNFPNGEICEFYRTSNFGTNESCGYCEVKLFRREFDGKPDMGSLIPTPDCPVWAKLKVKKV